MGNKKEEYEEYEIKLDRLTMIASVTEKIAHRLIESKLDTLEKIKSAYLDGALRFVLNDAELADKVYAGVRELLEHEEIHKMIELTGKSQIRYNVLQGKSWTNDERGCRMRIHGLNQERVSVSVTGKGRDQYIDIAIQPLGSKNDEKEIKENGQEEKPVG